MRDWKNWFKKAGIRAIKTMAQAAIGYIGGAAFVGDVNWIACGSAALIAGIVSMLTSLAGIPEENIDIDDYEILDRLGEDECDDI